MSSPAKPTPWAVTATATYRLGGPISLFLVVDQNWDTDCAGAPLVLGHKPSGVGGPVVHIRPDAARELRDLLTDWLADWDAIEARVEGQP